MLTVNRHNSDRRVARAKKRASAWLAVALLLGLLGAGNVAYGHWKASQYSQILQKNAGTNGATADQYSKRLGATIEFYQVVIFGGRSLLGVAALALIFSLLARRQGQKA